MFSQLCVHRSKPLLRHERKPLALRLFVRVSEIAPLSPWQPRACAKLSSRRWPPSVTSGGVGVQSFCSLRSPFFVESAPARLPPDGCGAASVARRCLWHRPALALAQKDKTANAEPIFSIADYHFPHRLSLAAACRIGKRHIFDLERGKDRTNFRHIINRQDEPA